MSEDALLKAQLLMQAAVALADLAREYRNNPEAYRGDAITPHSLFGPDRLLTTEILCPTEDRDGETARTIIRMEVPTKDQHGRAVIRVRHTGHPSGMRSLRLTPEPSKEKGKVVGEPIRFDRKPG